MFWVQIIRVLTETLNSHEGWLDTGSLQVQLLQIAVMLLETQIKGSGCPLGQNSQLELFSAQQILSMACPCSMHRVCIHLFLVWVFCLWVFKEKSCSLNQ